MKDPLVPEPRYGATRLFFTALVFIVLAPVYWLLTEHRPAQPPDGYENAGLYLEVYPQFHHAFGRLAAGEIPLWNAQQLCGTPMHTDPRLGLWSPLNAVFLALPTERAMAVHAYLCLSLMGFGTVMLLRALGASYVAAMFGGMVFAFSGAATGVMSWPGPAAVFALAPWTFWAATEHMWRFGWGGAVLTGTLLGLMGLAGSFGAALVFAIGLAGYLCIGAAVPPGYDAPRPAHRFTTLAVIPIVAAALSAVQWLPSLLWAFQSEGVAQAIWNFRPVAVRPRFPGPAQEWMGHVLLAAPGNLPKLAYGGILALALAPAALLHRDSRRWSYFMLAVCVGAWVLALAGSERMPWHFPAEAFAGPAALSFALLAALGMDRVLTAPDRPGVMVHVPPLLIVGAVTAALFIVTFGTSRGYLLILMGSLIFFAIVRRRWAAVLAGLCIAALHFVDVSVANVNRFQHPFGNAPACYTRYSGAIAMAQEQALGARILVSADRLDWGLPANIGMLTPLRAVNGAGIPLSREQDLWWRALTESTATPVSADAGAVRPGAGQPYLLNYMGARAIIVAPEAPLAGGQWAGPGPPLREVRTDGEGRVLVNGQALPRAYWAPAVHIADSPEEAIALLADGDFDASRFCVVDRSTPGVHRLGGEILALELAGADQPALTRADGACQVEDVSAERVTVRVHAPQLGMLVLADTYAPGWWATVNGARQVILRTNGMFRGVSVPPGEHVVTFGYTPLPFYAGAAVSLLTLVVVVLCALRGAFVAFLAPDSAGRNRVTPPPSITPLRKDES